MPNTATELMIHASNVTKVFRDFWGRPRVTAVKDVELQVRRGSVFGLLGPNGAGKSTLIKMILGHLYPTAGSLEVLGRPPADVASKQRLGYLPERAYLYKNLTPEETLRFFGEILELPAGEIRARTDQLLAMVGLDGSRKRLVGEFSHGMSRRMGLAQALLNDPDLLLLDEPTAGLDPLGCHEVKTLIMTLAQRGKTILLTSHLLGDVEDVCNEVMIMYGGRVLACGNIHELLAQKDMLQVRCPAPSADVMRRLSDLLQAELPASAVEFSSPTRSLETYFIDVVRTASKQRQTQGAQVGAGVAAYLREGVTESAPLLEALALARPVDAPRPDSAPSAAPPPDAVALNALASATPAAKAAESAASPAVPVDEGLLDGLTSTAPNPAVPPARNTGNPGQR